MSEATYTAWDDNLYEWPPPAGWYRADDEKWWPEGYGPSSAEPPGGDTSGDQPNSTLLKPERTATFPADGSGSADGGQSEEHLEAETQRPTYEELPSIDDVFGGSDPYADEDAEPAPSNGPENSPENGLAASDEPPPSIDDLFESLDIDSSDEDDGPGEGLVHDEVRTEPGYPDDDFDRIVENYDTTESVAAVDDDDVVVVDDDVAVVDDGDDVVVVDDGDDVVVVDDGDDVVVVDDDVVVVDDDVAVVDDAVDVESMVSGIHLGELPPDLADTADTADTADAAPGGDGDTGRPEAPIPSVAMHLDAAKGDTASVDTASVDTASADTASVDTAKVGVAETTDTGHPPPDTDIAPPEVGDSEAPATARPESGPVEPSTESLVEPEEDERSGRSGEHEVEHRSRRWPVAVVGITAVVVAGLVLYLLAGRGTEPGSFDVAASLQDPGPGSLGKPYSSDTGVVAFYNDAGTGDERRWVIQVVETVTDQSELLVAEQGAAAPIDGNVLAVSRLRVTYQSGPAPGDLNDLLLRSIGSSMTFFDQGNACRGPEPIDLDASLEPGQAVEGGLCWEVPVADLADLKLAVEAGPVDGIVFMDLN